MDSLVLDVSDVPDAVAGEIATFVGEDAGERITLEEAAALAGTIGYEVLTGLGTRLPRVYLERREA
jgi:alanine racemase